MAKIKDDIARGSAWIARALQSSGYQADFSPASLREIDRFFDDHSAAGKPKAGGLLAQDMGKRLFAVGCYIGEVLRRAKGGDWHGDDADPKVELNVELRFPGGTVCWPVQRALKRLQQGPAEGIPAYGVGLGLKTDSLLNPPKGL